MWSLYMKVGYHLIFEFTLRKQNPEKVLNTDQGNNPNTQTHIRLSLSKENLAQNK